MRTHQLTSELKDLFFSGILIVAGVLVAELAPKHPSPLVLPMIICSCGLWGTAVLLPFDKPVVGAILGIFLGIIFILLASVMGD